MSNPKGLSLIEMTIVITILGISALVIIPSFSSTDPHKLEYAANVVAQALRFARSESIRSGEIHGVVFNTDRSESEARDIRVFKADLTVSPFGNAGTLYHPLSKQPYDLWLEKGSVSKNVKYASTNSPFSFRGVAQAKKTIFFTAQGMPVYVEDGVVSPFSGGEVQLVYGGHFRTVTIQKTNGNAVVE